MEATRLIVGLTYGALLGFADSWNTTLAGIIIFGIGIIVGSVSVFISDRYVTRRMRREYLDWVASGRPERRSKPRRSSP